MARREHGFIGQVDLAVLRRKSPQIETPGKLQDLARVPVGTFEPLRPSAHFAPEHLLPRLPVAQEPLGRIGHHEERSPLGIERLLHL